MKKKIAFEKETLISILFTVIVIAALVVIFLLSGKRQSESDTLTATAATAVLSPAAQADSSPEKAANTAATDVPAAKPTPVPAVFGTDETAFVSALSASSLTVTEVDGVYHVSSEDDPVFLNVGRLITDLHDSRVWGFVLSYPLADTSADDDGSAISAALAMSDPSLMTASQANTMEDVYYAVLSAFDPDGEIPLTVRNEWCARLLSFQSDRNRKAYEAAYGRFRFSLYVYGSGVDAYLCCSVQYKA